MKHLYIIGNGFDLHHELNTSYQSFAFFLQERYSDIYNLLIEHFGLPHLKKTDSNSRWNPEWAQFETSLADLDFNNVLEAYQDYIGNPCSPEFRDSDWHTYQIELKNVVENLTDRLVAAFKEFILEEKGPPNINETRLKLEEKAIYLNFNYTDTLEKYYSIMPENILYIHHKASSGNKLILGHGRDPMLLKEPIPQPPSGLSHEELSQWQEQMADNFDLAFEMGKSELETYFEKSFKNTASIIADNESFFDGCQNVEKVTILGLSLSEVDLPYIKKIIPSVKVNAEWSVSFYKTEEEGKHQSALLSMGIKQDKIKTFKMNDLI